MVEDKMAGDKFISSTLPKSEIQALDFISAYPTYDGRNVKVAILDTGVDPGSAGLQETTTGLPKIIDIRDCSGAGDVDTSTTVTGALKDTASGNNAEEASLTADNSDLKAAAIIKSKTGKNLYISKKTFESNPTNSWNVGQKALYEFLPRGLTNRMKKQYKEKQVRMNNDAIRDAKDELKSWKLGKSSTLTREEIRQQSELENRIALLEGAANATDNIKNLTLDDPGSLIDCVVFKDKDDVWRVLIDTKGDGDLTKSTALASFHVERQYIRWDEASQLNVCVNVYANGSKVNIVADVGDHGTHVASILAGYHKDNPDLNGVAPGAQLISLKIGDGRLGSMETATSMIRAISMAAALGADVINMSYGEASTLPLDGRVVKLMEELVHKHGVIFVTSAGNSGPALSTVGSPACSSDSIIGVGAYVTPDMMVSQYNMRSDVGIPATNFTWSSRGPSYAGNLGVSISAPGGAIASVSEWTLQQKGQKNGTSMASPNACGGVALILSGLIQSGTHYSPARVKRAIEATTTKIKNLDIFSQGNGLIQVLNAFEHIMLERIGERKDLWYLDLPFHVRVGQKAGIYLREPADCSSVSRHIVSLIPKFNDTESYDHKVENSNPYVVTHWPTSYRNQLQVDLVLKCDANWIKLPERILLHGAESFAVIIDPTKLAPGQYFSWVEVYASSRSPDAGPLLKVPISVIRPDNLASTDKESFSIKNVNFSPGTVLRKFLVVPDGATWMDVRVSCPNVSENIVSERLFYVHCLQMQQGSCYRDDEMKARNWLQNEAGSEINRSVAVKPGTVEICVSQFWKSEGIGSIDLEVQFRGVQPVPSNVCLSADNGYVAKVVLRPKLQSVRVEPMASFKYWHKTISPIASKTELFQLNAGFRDEILPFREGSNYTSRKIWSLELQYNFKQVESGKVKISLPVINTLLYDSPLDYSMCMLFDENKQLLAVEDYLPSSITLGKGTYTVRVCLRHENPDILSDLKTTGLLVTRTISKPLNVSAFKSLDGTITSQKKFTPAVLGKGKDRTLYLKVSSNDVPSGASEGDVLTGSISYCRRASKEKGRGGEKMPGGFPITYVLPPKASTENEKPKLKEETDSELESKTKVLKTYIVPMIQSRISPWKNVDLKHKNLFDEEYKEILALTEKYSDTPVDELDDLKFELLQIALDWSVARFNEQTSDSTAYDDVNKACENVLNEVPDGFIKENHNKNVDFDDISDKSQNEKRLGKFKKIVSKVLCIKLLSNIQHNADVDVQATKDDFSTLSLIGDASDPMLIQLKMERFVKLGNLASSIKYLNMLLSEDSAKLSSLSFKVNKKDLLLRRIEYCEKLGWGYLAEVEKAWMKKRFPSDYALF